jgi:hypothetical protein
MPKKLDDATMKALAAYTGLVRACPPSAKVPKRTDRGDKWLADHKDDPVVVDERKLRKQRRREAYEAARIRKHNAEVRKRRPS